MSNLFLKKYTNGIYVKLGYDCNGCCVYCAQFGHEKEQLILNIDIIDYIATQSAVNRKCDDDKYVIVFYGGEPLLYFDVMKIIVSGLYANSSFQRSNIKFICITNGTLLNDEIVDFFNMYNIHCRLSFDGPNVAARPVRIDVQQKKLFMKINDKDIYFVWSSLNNNFLKSKIYLEKVFPDVKSEMVMCRYVAKNEEYAKFVINSKYLIKQNFDDLLNFYSFHNIDHFFITLLSNKFLKNNNIEVIDISGNRHHSCDYISYCGDIYSPRKTKINYKAKSNNEECLRCSYNNICNGSRRSNIISGNIFECRILCYINYLYDKHKETLFNYLVRDGYIIKNYDGFKCIKKDF